MTTNDSVLLSDGDIAELRVSVGLTRGLMQSSAWAVAGELLTRYLSDAVEHLTDAAPRLLATISAQSQSIEELRRQLAERDEALRVEAGMTRFWKRMVGAFGVDCETFKADGVDSEEILSLLASTVKALERSGQPRAADAVRFVVKTYGRDEEEVTALETTIADLTAENRRLQTAVRDAVDEHEAALNPEDVGCAERIESLTARLTTTEKERDERQRLATYWNEQCLEAWAKRDEVAEFAKIELSEARERIVALRGALAKISSGRYLFDLEQMANIAGLALLSDTKEQS